MRKILAILLAVLMVVPAFAFTTSAEEATTTLPAIEFIPIVTEDNMPTGGSCDNAKLESQLWNGLKWNGVGSSDKTLAYDAFYHAVYYTIGSSTAGAHGVNLDIEKTVDISSMTTLHFDLYISDVNAVKDAGGWRMEIRHEDGTTRKYQSALSEWHKAPLVSGWNHFEIPMNVIPNYTAANFKGLRFFNNDGNAAIGPVTIMLKNMYFAKDTIPVILTTDMVGLTDAEKANMNLWHASVYPQWRGQSAFDGKLTYDDATGGVGYKATGSMGNGAGYWLKTAKLDVTSMDKLCFDLFVSDIETANADTVIWRVQIKNSTKGHTRTIQQPLTELVKLSGGTLVSGWNHFEIPFSVLDNSAANLTQVDQIYIRVWDSANGSTFGAAGKELQILLKDIYYAYTPKKAAIDPVIMTTDMVGLTDAEKANMNLWHASVYPQWRGQSAFDGKLTYDDATGGVGYKATGSMGNGAGYWLKTAKKDVTAMDKLCFDLFVSDIEAANADLVIWRVQIKNSTKNHTRTIQQPLTELIKLSGGTLVNGWNHFEIPFSVLDNSAANLTQVDQIYIRVLDSTNGGKFGTAGKELQIMLKDIYYADEGAAAVAASVVPTLENDVNLTFKVTTNENAVYKPYVKVTFNGATVVKPVAADGTFSFNDILAHRLSDMFTIEATTVDLTGNITTTTFDYSVKQYAANKLAGDESDELKALVSNLLHYGAASQAVIDYNMENLANNVDGILEAVALDTETLASYHIANPVNDTRTDVVEGAPKWKGATLVLDSAICIRFTFTADTKPAKVRNMNDNKLLFINKNEDGSYYVDVPVNAADFGTEYTLAIDDDQSNTVTYSVNAYIARKYQNYQNNPDGSYGEFATGAEMFALLTAIYNYGASAEAYIAE